MIGTLERIRFVNPISQIGKRRPNGTYFFPLLVHRDIKMGGSVGEQVGDRWWRALNARQRSLDLEKHACFRALSTHCVPGPMHPLTSSSQHNHCHPHFTGGKTGSQQISATCQTRRAGKWQSRYSDLSLSDPSHPQTDYLSGCKQNRKQRVFERCSIFFKPSHSLTPVLFY